MIERVFNSSVEVINPPQADLTVAYVLSSEFIFVSKAISADPIVEHTTSEFLLVPEMGSSVKITNDYQADILRVTIR